MAAFTCPICGGSCPSEDAPGFCSFIRCKKGYGFYIHSDIDGLPNDTKNKLYNLILEHLLRKPKCDKLFWSFDYDTKSQANNQLRPSNYINLTNALDSYPDDFIERVNRTLLNLSILYPNYGDFIGQNYIDVHAAYSASKDVSAETAGLFDLMTELGYLKHDKDTAYTISADGWKKIEQLSKQQQEIKQGFIAMEFSDKTTNIRDAFRKAIKESKFTPRIIDEKEHNNQIVPEIFYEIERSKFVVVDISFPNYGAYYEAGYAQGLGKQVIVCCKREVFDNREGKFSRPHFDIAQKCMVIWDDEADLVEKLRRRIDATINNPNYKST